MERMSNIAIVLAILLGLSIFIDVIQSNKINRLEKVDKSIKDSVVYYRNYCKVYQDSINETLEGYYLVNKNDYSTVKNIDVARKGYLKDKIILNQE